jgi:hypothetical protein
VRGNAVTSSGLYEVKLPFPLNPAAPHFPHDVGLEYFLIGQLAFDEHFATIGVEGWRRCGRARNTFQLPNHMR